MLLIETPALDEIAISAWFTTKYSAKQKEEIKVLVNNHIWITARKVKLPVRTMDTQHIINCINCLNGKGKTYIPPTYLGGKNKWLKIFKEELINRQ